MKIAIVLPVYNEESGIKHFHEYLVNYIQNFLKKNISKNFSFELIYVLDKSTDHTQDILESLAGEHNTTVIVMSSRFGHQESILAGIDYANASEFDALIMMDSDLQHPPEIIEPMLTKFVEGNDIVFTTRLHTEKINFFRKKVGDIFYWAINKISDTQINPNSTDFRLISKNVIKILSQQIEERNLFLRGIFSWVGFSQANVDFIANARTHGHSKYSISDLLRLATSGTLAFSTKPLRIGIDIGVFCALFAFVMGAYFVVDYFFDKNIPGGWTTLAVLVTFFSGLQLIVMGIIGLYIGSILREVKGRPRYIIEKIVR